MQNHFSGRRLLRGSNSGARSMLPQPQGTVQLLVSRKVGGERMEEGKEQGCECAQSAPSTPWHLPPSFSQFSLLPYSNFKQTGLLWLSLCNASCPLLKNLCHPAVLRHLCPLKKCPGLPMLQILLSQENKRQASCLLVHPKSSPQTPLPCSLLLGLL